MAPRKTYAPGREEQRSLEERISALNRERVNTEKEISSLNTQLAALQDEFEPLQQIKNEAKKLAFKHGAGGETIPPQDQKLMNTYQQNLPKMEKLSKQADEINRQLGQKNSALSNVNTQIEKLMGEKAVQDMKLHAQENLKQDSSVEWIKGDRYGKGNLASELLNQTHAEELKKCVQGFLQNENVSGQVSVQQSKNTPGQYRVFVPEADVAQAYANSQNKGGHSLATDTHFDEFKESHKKASPRRQ